jgi:hypothetical protein
VAIDRICRGELRGHPFFWCAQVLVNLKSNLNSLCI